MLKSGYGVRRHRQSAGFTLIELLVVIAIIAILAAVIFPVLGRAKEKALSTACLSNMQQIARAVMLYTQDYNGHVPVCHDVTASMADDNGYWWVTLHPYTKNDQVFVCPAWRPSALPDGLLFWEKPQDTTKPFARGGIVGTYAWNLTMNGAPESLLSGTSPDGIGYSPASVAAVAEGFNGTHIWKKEQVAPLDSPENRLRYVHNGGANVAFADGHARWYRADQMRASMWAPWDTEWRP